ncbi:MAG: hypothetical protein BMS9Abin29_1608 [Gemmatimonadota bacterium]|nr:MAG: hypothetical protein BMS9Abin29_1608 [Gemmatimonadota bacterium]
MAAPFVKGRLEGTTVSAVVETVCAQSGRPLVFELDSRMAWWAVGEAVRPMVFEPRVDWSTFDDLTILHGY